MNRINGLSDDLLLKILLFLPTKVSISTSILSKRWEHLWMWLPKLEFDDSSYSNSECERLQSFLVRNFPLHKATVIESLRFNFTYKVEDVKRWVEIAVSRSVRELEISFSIYVDSPNIVPTSLYACESLVVLKLNGAILLDVPRMVSLPCLKTLELRGMIYSHKESLHWLLSTCPILEDLLVEFTYVQVGDMRKFSIIIPSLQSLSLCMPNDVDELVINTPSLKYFKLESKMEGTRLCLIENMPKLREAYVDVGKELSNIKSLIRSITSVKSLTLCVKYNGLEAVFDDGFVFNQLEHLKLCVCRGFDFAVRFLKHCPNLRELEFSEIYEHFFGFVTSWTEPTMVPECIVSNLRIFNWSDYYGSPGEGDLGAYFFFF